MMRDADTQALIRRALREDVGPGDVTTAAVVAPDQRCTARLVAKQAGVVSGIGVFAAVFHEVSAAVSVDMNAVDGQAFAAGDVLARVMGPAQAVLTGERVALNFVQRLTGVATLTAAYVRAVAGTRARIVDTRKTTPLLRSLEKRAVRHGGGRNHRHGLYDGILIKENHIRAAGGITAAIGRAQANAHHLLQIEVEVTTLDEFDEALAARPGTILLDNMAPDAMAEAVARRGDAPVLLEASGNVSLETVRAIAETGVDLVSAGALTHSAPAADLSLLFDRA